MLTENGEVIYVGKTDASLKQRIDAHEKEDKFAPFLGLCQIEYVELANSVETDIVEKFLINKWKPLLNEKDKTEGLSSVSMCLPNWLPYKVYEDKKSKNTMILCNAIKKAEEDNELFWHVYNAILAKEDFFISRQLHPTGLLALPSAIKKMTALHVDYIGNGYKQFLNKEILSEVECSPYQIQANIWIPVAKLWNFNVVDEKYWEELLDAWNFASTLYVFRENGFCEDCDSERGILHINCGKLSLQYYKELFFNVIATECGHIAEVDKSAYNKIPHILEKIAKDTLIFFKITGVISYTDEKAC